MDIFVFKTTLRGYADVKAIAPFMDAEERIGRWTVVLLFLFPLYLLGQTTEDSLANDFRTFAAKNISRYRTLNLSYETKWAHDYTFTVDGNEVEKGRKKNLHTLRFSAMVPIR